MITDNSFIRHTVPWTYNESSGPFFIPEVYKNLTDILYSDAIKDWKIYNDDGSDPAYPQGTVIMIDDEAREQATGFLRDFYDWLWTGEIEAKIYEVTGVKFTDHSKLWHLDYSGFDQDWHNDEDAYPTMQVTTFQVYMARDESKKDSGVLLSSNTKEAQAQVPYLPNHAWAFSANANTWHAVKPIDFYRPSFLIREFAEKE